MVQGPSYTDHLRDPCDDSIQLCLTSLYKTLERFTLTIKVFGKRCKAHLKSSSGSIPANTRTVYNTKLAYLKSKWDPNVRQLFFLLKDQSMYETFANDIINALNESWRKCSLPDELYRLALEAIVTPIIEDIMGENMIGQIGLDLQMRRKQFVDYLIPNLSHDAASHESIQVLDILMDALTRHCNRIVKLDADNYELIHHIMNITHVFDLLKTRLRKLKLQIQGELFEEHTIVPNKNLQELIEKFEDDIKRNLELFEVGFEMSMLVDYLTELLIELRLLKSIMS